MDRLSLRRDTVARRVRGEWQRGSGRKCEAERRAFARHATALDPDATVHRLRQEAAQIQADASAAHRSGDVTLEAHEAVEELGGVARGHTQPAVAHADL